MNSIFRLILSAFILVTSFYVANTARAEDPIGSRNNPIKLFFTPSVDQNKIAVNSESFIKFMEKETGYYMKSAIPASYIAVVEALGSNRADVAVMNSFGYLLANSKYGAVAKLKTLRHGKDFYSGAIFVNNKSGIKSVKDLNGKKFAFTDSSSTSGYLFPLKILNDHKIKLGNTMFAIKHDNVITMVYQGQVDAGAAFYDEPFEGKIQDARDRVRTQFPDVESKVSVIKVTDKITNDPFVFRKGLPEAVTQKFIKALLKYITTEEGKATFKNIYGIDGIVPASDKDYESLRKVIKATNTDVGSLVK